MEHPSLRSLRPKWPLLAFLILGWTGAILTLVQERSILMVQIDPTRDLSETDHHPVGWYGALAHGAVTVGDFDTAKAALDEALVKDPNNAAAWQLSALVETELNGRPSRKALEALLNAYELAPYPAPKEMIWRVEFAARHWAAMPDVVQEKTLTQMAVLAALHKTLWTRAEWCNQFPTGALAEAACSTIPEAMDHREE